MQRMLKYRSMETVIAIDRVVYYTYYQKDGEVFVTVYLDNGMDLRLPLTEKEFRKFENEFFLCEGNE